MREAENDIRTKVLLVEPDSIVSLYACEVLEQAGFNVMEAGSAEEAITALTNTPDIAILFTASDNRSGLDGLKLAAQVADGWPPVRIVVTSGDRLIDPDDLPPHSRFIPKPYSETELLATLRLLEKQWLSRIV